MNSYIADLIRRYPSLDGSKQAISEAYATMEQAFYGGGKLLIAGNGGSASDAAHIAGELMKGFVLPRPVTEAFAKELTAVDPERGSELCSLLECGLPAIALIGQDALCTAYLNDVGPDALYAQQILGLGRPGDVFLGISTSGNSKNILYAAVTAKALGMKVIGLTGTHESALSGIADICVRVPETETYKIQELHLPVYHCWCLMLEDRFFGKKA